MACITRGAIAMGGKCQRCKTATRLARISNHETQKKTKPQSYIEAQPESAQSAGIPQGSLVGGTQDVVDSDLPEREAPVSPRPRPEWHPEPEVEEARHTNDELPRHYLQREGQKQKRVLR